MEPLRGFGSQEYAHVDSTKRTKLDPKSYKCMLLGNAENAKGYRVYDSESSKIELTRSVQLDEREANVIYDTPCSEKNQLPHVVKEMNKKSNPFSCCR